MSSIESVATTQTAVEMAEAEISMPEAKKAPTQCIRREMTAAEKIKEKIKKLKEKKIWIELKIEELEEELEEEERIYDI